MLERLDKDKLVELAEQNNVHVDKRWARERIVKALADKKIKAPEADDSKLSERIDLEPVKFMSTLGRIVVRDAKPATLKNPDGDVGLIVDFGTGFGDEATLAGGFSREFYPDLDDHDTESAYCSCASCLADVRDWIKLDKHSLVNMWKIGEADLDAPKSPLPSAKAWQDVHADDLPGLHKATGFDVRNAIRYEKRNHKRPTVIKALDKIASGPVEPVDADISTAEITV